MGPRGAARRSEGEVISGQHDKTPSMAASRWRELWRRRGTWAYVALLAAVSAVCAFLPLADHLGYELAEVVALCAGLFGAAPGVAAARAEASRPDADAARATATAVLLGLSALAVPVALILLNALRRLRIRSAQARRMDRRGGVHGDPARVALARGPRPADLRLPPPGRLVSRAHLRRGHPPVPVALDLPDRDDPLRRRVRGGRALGRPGPQARGGPCAGRRLRPPRRVALAPRGAVPLEGHRRRPGRGAGRFAADGAHSAALPAGEARRREAAARARRGGFLARGPGVRRSPDRRGAAGRLLLPGH